MEKGISYLNRNFEDYKEALIEFSKKYYPDLATSYDDASVGAWQIDIAADVADNLSYHIDRVYQETNIDSAQERASFETGGIGTRFSCWFCGKQRFIGYENPGEWFVETPKYA